jgi:hypothetical protein
MLKRILKPIAAKKALCTPRMSIQFSHIRIKRASDMPMKLVRALSGHATIPAVDNSSPQCRFEFRGSDLREQDNSPEDQFAPS